ncbi:putative solute:sodium symporter small subunit [Archaeoglobus sulfaticallidus PM70-1]|uniref:Putative solute:sodium symporter small subunit n=2 Tax=Archaeoglobus TaxID=2233 RepID=N0BKD2_9EURY|nr:putative solute:sodium symporter small subunit [Archaeoglobus sulfaticallidus PM70-1]
MEEVSDLSERYWKRLKKITIIWMLAWTFPAILLHIPVEFMRRIYFNGIPMHWFNAAFLAIVIGIALIFLYAYVMDRTDRELLGR